MWVVFILLIFHPYGIICTTEKIDGNIIDAITKPCVITPEPNTLRIFRIVLKQGLNRQIRRMCNKYNYQVLKLQRVRIMNIKLGKLKVGEWRELTEEELTTLLSQLSQ